MDSDISSNHEVFPLRDLTSHLESVCEMGVVSTTVIQRFDNLQTGIFAKWEMSLSRGAVTSVF